MSLCLLDGHIPALMQGAGEFAGREFLICQRCGKMLDDEPRPPEWPQARENWLNARDQQHR